jgi:hypothetical protein
VFYDGASFNMITTKPITTVTEVRVIFMDTKIMLLSSNKVYSYNSGTHAVSLDVD